MSTTTVGFAVADEDQERLARLVEHFGHGNRSAYLRATLPVMESLARAERLRELQARNAERAAAAGQDYESLLAEIRRAYKGGTPGQSRPQALSGACKTRRSSRVLLTVLFAGDGGRASWSFVGGTGPPSAAAGDQTRHETASRIASAVDRGCALTTPLSRTVLGASATFSRR